LRISGWVCTQNNEPKDVTISIQTTTTIITSTPPPSQRSETHGNSSADRDFGLVLLGIMLAGLGFFAAWVLKKLWPTMSSPARRLLAMVSRQSYLS